MIKKFQYKNKMSIEFLFLILAVSLFFLPTYVKANDFFTCAKSTIEPGESTTCKFSTPMENAIVRMSYSVSSNLVVTSVTSGENYSLATQIGENTTTGAFMVRPAKHTAIGDTVVEFSIKAKNDAITSDEKITISNYLIYTNDNNSSIDGSNKSIEKSINIKKTSSSSDDSSDTQKPSGSTTTDNTSSENNTSTDSSNNNYNYIKEENQTVSKGNTNVKNPNTSDKNILALLCLGIGMLLAILYSGKKLLMRR